MWKAAFYCVKCDHRVGQNQICFADGVCPYCGHCSEGPWLEVVKRSEEVTDKVEFTEAPTWQCADVADAKAIAELGLAFDKKSVEPFKYFADLPWWQRLRKAIGRTT